MATFQIKDLMVKILPDAGAAGVSPCDYDCTQYDCSDCGLTWFTTGCTPSPLTRCTPFPCTAAGNTNKAPSVSASNLERLRAELRHRLAILEAAESSIKDEVPSAAQLESLERELLSDLARVREARGEQDKGDKKSRQKGK